MENILLNAVLQFGAVGILIFVLVSLVIRYERRMEKVHYNHKDEREAWREQALLQHSEVINVATNSNVLLAEIKIMIASIKK